MTHYNALQNIILYIQSEYDFLISNLTADEKEIINKYLLDISIKYYNDLGELPPEQEITVGNTKGSNIALLSATTVCTLTIFSDKSTNMGYSSGFHPDIGTHSWIHVKNTSASPILVGKLNVPA